MSKDIDLLAGSVPLDSEESTPPVTIKIVDGTKIKLTCDVTTEAGIDEVMLDVWRRRFSFQVAGGYTRVAREVFPVATLPESAMDVLYDKGSK